MSTPLPQFPERGHGTKEKQLQGGACEHPPSLSLYFGLAFLPALLHSRCIRPGTLLPLVDLPSSGSDPERAHSAQQFATAARPDLPLDRHTSLLSGPPTAGWLVLSRPLWLLCPYSIQVIHWLPVTLRVGASVCSDLWALHSVRPLRLCFSVLSCPGLSLFFVQPCMLLSTGLCSVWSLHLNSSLVVCMTSSKTFQLLLEKPHASNKTSCAPYLALLNFTSSLFTTFSIFIKHNLHEPSSPLLFTEESPVPRGGPGMQLVFHT